MDEPMLEENEPTLDEVIRSVHANCVLNESEDCPYKDDFPNDCQKVVAAVVDYAHGYYPDYPIIQGRML